MQLILADVEVSVEETLLITHLLTLTAFGFAMLVMGRVFFEHSKPSNVFAWMLLIFFLPYIGVPLYLIFGGRKNKKLIAGKRKVQILAAAAAGIPIDADSDPPPTHGTYDGNSFRLVGDGVSSYHALCDEIKKAKHHIHITVYILTDDDTGRPIVDLLCQRARAGVKVRVLVDALGSFTQRGRLLQRLRKAGAQAVRFMPVLPIHRRSSANLRNHRKVAIFDNQRAWVGGQNFDRRFLSSTPSPTLFKDYSTLIEGPAVTALTRMFVGDWCYAAKMDPAHFSTTLSTDVERAGDAVIEVIPSGPDASKDRLWERIVLMIQEYQHSLTIVTPYFIPDEVIFQSLLVKISAGYPLKIILPYRSNHFIAEVARGHYLRKLSQAGAEILMYNESMLHGKLMIADKQTALTGSANIDMRSLFLNFEIGLVHRSPQPVKELEEWINDIEPSCVPYNTLPMANPGPVRRMMENVARLLVPLL